MYASERERVETLIDKKWVVESDPARLSYNFSNGKVTIAPSNETCEYKIHQVTESSKAWRIDIFRPKVTEVWDICAIGDHHMLWANTADEKKGVYRILRVVTSQ
jgi:hypothetical protein